MTATEGQRSSRRMLRTKKPMMFAAVAALSMSMVMLPSVEAGLQDDLTNGDIKYTSCFSNPDQFGWEKMRNFTQNKRPIVLEQAGWESARLATRILQIILTEIMGFKARVLYQEYQAGYALTSARLKAANVTDIAMEIWSDPLPGWYSHGAIGYQGRSGMYVPSRFVSQYPEFGYDFWRFLQNPHARSNFLKYGKGPKIRNPDGSYLCDGKPGLCEKGRYVPKWFTEAESDNFVELWLPYPGWSTYRWQRMIDGLKLNATLNWLGENFDSIVTQYVNNASAPGVIFYNCRLMFPYDSSGDFAKHTAGKIEVRITDSDFVTTDPANVPLTVDEPQLMLQKGSSIPFVAEFPDVSKLLANYVILDDSINAMLKEMAGNIDYMDVGCNWMKKNPSLWTKWIPSPPKSYVLTKPKGKKTRQKPATRAHTREFALVAQPLTIQAGNCTMTSSCADGFTGLLCTECSDPNQALWRGKCIDCEKAGSSLYLLIFMSFFATFALLFVPRHELPTVELLFFFFQVINLIFGASLGELLGFGELKTFLALASLDMDGMAVDCPAKLTGVSKLMFRFLLPSMFFVHLGLLYGIFSTLKKFKVPVEKIFPYYLKDQSMDAIFFKGLLTIITFVMMPLLEASVSLLECRNIVDKTVLHKAPNVQCFKGSHVGPVTIAIIILVIILGVLPLTIFVVLNNLKRANQITYDKHGNLSHYEQMLQNLYLQYKPEFLFIEAYFILERGAIVIFFTVFSEDNKWSAFGYILLIGTIMLVRIYVQPFQSRLEAYLSREVCQCWIILLAFKYTAYQPEALGIAPYVIAIMFLPPTLHIVRLISVYTKKGGNGHAHGHNNIKKSIEDLAKNVGGKGKNYNDDSERVPLSTENLHD
ncbi:hypothetical protein HDU97_007014 [Phlyctochytrium planicorne]|nr:hypothetical protein HDU97_007014 [Phlyctochytrium planicorne]